MKESEEPAEGARVPMPGGAPIFATTRWTRVLAAKGDSARARMALKDLCAVYYEPVVAYLRCGGRGEEKARELAHEFFARLLDRHGLENLEKGRSRFRSYLLGALQHYLGDRRDRERAAKRGGGEEAVPLREGTDTSPGVDPIDARGRTPEEEFDRQWALTLLDRGLRELGTEHEAAGKGVLFAELKGWLTGDVEGVTQAEVAARLGMNEGAVKVAIHRLRKRFREVVKAQIAETLTEEEQVEEELGNLILALG